MLSELFSSFDRMCVEYDVYKVHTIGDCYVVLGLSSKNQRDPVSECLNVVKIAESMVEIINSQNQAHGSQLNMRIGIHIGEVIAGVIGTNTVRYDMWGPDVLIANKMESSGVPGMINVSEITKNLMEANDNYHKFVHNKEVEIASLGKNIQSFLISN